MIHKVFYITMKRLSHMERCLLEEYGLRNRKKLMQVHEVSWAVNSSTF